MPVRQIHKGQDFRIILDAPSFVRWSADDWATFEESPTRYSSFGFQTVELPSNDLAPGRSLKFTFRAKETGEWEGRDYEVEIV